MSVAIDSELVEEILGQLQPLETFSDFVRKTTRALEMERRFRKLFQKYVPASVLTQVFNSLFKGTTGGSQAAVEPALPAEADEGGETTPAPAGSEPWGVTFMFSSIDRYMAFAERLGAADLAAVLSTYLRIVRDSVTNYFGAVDNFTADRAMAYWSGPGVEKEHGLLACKCALEIQQSVSTFVEALPETHRFSVRIGIISGERAISDDSPEDITRRETLIGDTVNVASALEEANKTFGTRVLVSQATYEAARRSLDVRSLGERTLKSRLAPVLLYELLGVEESPQPEA